MKFVQRFVFRQHFLLKFWLICEDESSKQIYNKSSNKFWEPSYQFVLQLTSETWIDYEILE